MILEHAGVKVAYEYHLMTQTYVAELLESSEVVAFCAPSLSALKDLVQEAVQEHQNEISVALGS